MEFVIRDSGCGVNHAVGAVQHEEREFGVDFVNTPVYDRATDTDGPVEHVVSVDIGGSYGDVPWRRVVSKQDGLGAVRIYKTVWMQSVSRVY